MLYTDINECESQNNCSQLCHNLPGSYSCSCADGYIQKEERSYSCKVAKGKIGLLLTYQTDLMLMDEASRLTTVVAAKSYPTALDYHHSKGLYFWISSESHSLMSSSFSNSKPSVVVPNLTGVDNFAIDWVHDNIYWTDASKQRISAFNIGLFF